MPLCVSTTALADPARETTAERVDNLCPSGWLIHCRGKGRCHRSAPGGVQSCRDLFAFDTGSWPLTVYADG